MASALHIASTFRLASGNEIPVLGLGVYQNKSCIPAVVAALKKGYKNIDSANAYQNEDAVGQGVREAGADRKNIWITSKVTSKNHGYDKTTSIVDNSLRLMGTDYIDLYLIHDPLSGKEKRLESWKALLDAKKAGKIRDAGVSNYSEKHIEEIRAAGLELPTVNQIELHPFCQQKPIVEYCQKHNIFVQAYSPLVRGAFDNAVFRQIADKYKKDVAQVLVRWSLQRGFGPLPKSEKPERVESNADVFDFELAQEDVAALNSLDRGKQGAITWNPVDAE